MWSQCYIAIPVFCPPPPEVGNATWRAPGAYLVPVNTLVRYKCRADHEFPDEKTSLTIVCLGSGQWSRNPGHCACKLLGHVTPRWVWWFYFYHIPFKKSFFPHKLVVMLALRSLNIYIHGIVVVPVRFGKPPGHGCGCPQTDSLDVPIKQ